MHQVNFAVVREDLIKITNEKKKKEDGVRCEGFQGYVSIVT